MSICIFNCGSKDQFTYGTCTFICIYNIIILSTKAQEFDASINANNLFLSWIYFIVFHVESLQWRHNGVDGVSNHRRLDCLFNRLLRCRSNKTSKLCVTGFCQGNPPVTGGLPSQRASDAENVSIWWRRHDEALFHQLWHAPKEQKKFTINENTCRNEIWYKWCGENKQIGCV